MTTALARGRPSAAKIQARGRALQARASGNVARRRTLPEYLEWPDVGALLRFAPHPQAALVMLVQARAGLRVKEALGLERADLFLETERPTLKVGWLTAKGSKERIVPVHPELAAALRTAVAYGAGKGGPLVAANPSTAWRWVQEAYRRAVAAGALPPGRRIGTHTLRHSAARHWLESGVPLNRVSVWLGHASLQTTLIYLEILPDALGDMARVP